MDECDVVGTIDFGKGYVDVRCSKTGPHQRHKFEDPEPDLNIEHRRNVFDDTDI